MLQSNCFRVKFNGAKTCIFTVTIKCCTIQPLTAKQLRMPAKFALGRGGGGGWWRGSGKYVYVTIIGLR